MIQPIKFSDDPLMMDIPETATKFEYENMLFIVLHPEKKEFDFLFINKKEPRIHYHMYQEKGEIYFHKTYYENGIKKRDPIDTEQLLQTLTQMVSEVLAKVEKIEVNDSRFLNEMVYFLTPHQLHIKNKTKTKVIFGQKYDVDETSFSKINTDLHKVGFTFDENNAEKDMIFVKDGSIFRLGLEHLKNIDD